VQLSSLTVWLALNLNQKPTGDMLTDGNVPRICFINKLDRMGASFERSFKSILDRLNKNAIRMQIPIGLEENFLKRYRSFENEGLLF
jgi:translation elongation factor EF-G